MLDPSDPIVKALAFSGMDGSSVTAQLSLLTSRSQDLKVFTYREQAATIGFCPNKDDYWSWLGLVLLNASVTISVFLKDPLVSPLVPILLLPRRHHV